MRTVSRGLIGISIFLLMGLVLMLVGCGQPIGKVQDEKEPFDEQVDVESFRGNRTIEVKWRGDINADEYVLMRARDEIGELASLRKYIAGEKRHIETDRLGWTSDTYTGWTRYGKEKSTGGKKRG